MHSARKYFLSTLDTNWAEYKTSVSVTFCVNHSFCKKLVSCNFKSKKNGKKKNSLTRGVARKMNSFLGKPVNVTWGQKILKASFFVSSTRHFQDDIMLHKSTHGIFHVKTFNRNNFPTMNCMNQTKQTHPKQDDNWKHNSLHGSREPWWPNDSTWSVTRMIKPICIFDFKKQGPSPLSNKERGFWWNSVVYREPR